MRFNFPTFVFILACFFVQLGPVSAQSRGEASAFTKSLLGQQKPDTVGSGGEYREEFSLALPAFRDLPPSLSLVYSSSNTARGGTDNFVGFGWRLNGLSMIERQTVGGGVPMFDDGQDLYVVDGQQLMACADASATSPWTGFYPLRYKTAVASASCSAGGNFAARIEDFRRYFFDATNNIWTVTDPSGHRSVYKPISVFSGTYNAQDQSDVRQLTKTRWVLAEVADTQKDATGQYTNKVTFGWYVGAATDGRPVVPASISYAGYEVSFNYQIMSSPVAFFGTGTAYLGQLRHQLRSVTVKEGSSQIRAYNLIFQTTALTGTRLVSRIENYGSDYIFDAGQGLVTSGSKLPDTSYSYTPEQISFDARTYSGANFAGGTLAMDDNHDGRDDLFVFGGTTYTRNSSNGAWTLNKSYVDSRFGFDSARTITLKAGVVNPCQPEQSNLPLDGTVVTQAESNTRAFSVPKLLGDDRLTSGASCANVTISKTKIGGSGSDEYKYFSSFKTIQFLNQSASGTATAPVNKPTLLTSANLDYDNWLEVMYNNQYWDVNDTVPVSYGAFSTHSNGNEPKKPVPATASDLNGDGVTELLFNDLYATLRKYSFIAPEAGYYGGALKSKGAVLFEIDAPVDPNAGFNNTGIGAAYSNFGDVNGDGITDAVSYSSKNADELDILFGTGTSFVAQQHLYLGDHFSNGAKAWLQDINRDGYDDLIVQEKYPVLSSDNAPLPPGLRGLVMFNRGGTFVDEPASTFDFPVLLETGDFDGDGQTDIVGNLTSRGSCSAAHASCRDFVMNAIWFGSGGIPHLMTGVTRSTGETTSIAYGSSTNLVSGIKQMPAVQTLVQSISQNDGRSSVQTFSFGYEDSRYDFTNRKALGFGKVVATLPLLAGEVDPPRIVATYHNTHFANSGLIESRETVQGTSVLSRETYGYAFQTTGNGPWRADRTSERNATLFGAALVETSLTSEVNAFGQLTRETALGFTTNGVDLDPSDNVTVTTGYIPNLAAYIVDRPAFRREEAGSTPTAPLANDLSYTAFTYDAAAGAPTIGNPSKVEEWTGNPSALTLRTVKLVSYDDWGNILTETDARAAAAGSTPTVSYGYDTAKHLLRLTTTNTLGHVETVAWNTPCQAPATITDPNLRVTTKTYDGFCRETRTDLPGGQYQITSYVAFGSPMGQFVQRQTKSGSAVAGREVTTSREYFDGLGRVWAQTQSGTLSHIDDSALQLTAYDARGNLAWSSLPLPFSSLNTTPNAAQRTSFSYDGNNRPVDTLLPDGAKRSLSYLTVSLSHFGGPTLAYPATKASDEHCFDATSAGTICGELTQITDAAGELIRADRKDTALTDIDAGGATLRSTSYRYDPKGNLIAVTDPGGIAFAYTYDVYGNRLTASDPGLGFWTLTYDANNNLLTQTDAKGQLISFGYDALNRVTLKTVGTGPARVETRFTYDQPRAGFYNKGRETTQEVWTPTGTTHKVERDWHLMGGLAVERHTIDTRTYALETSFAPNGAPLDQKLPGTPGATTTGWLGPFTYDAAGRVTAMTGYITSVTYNAWGQPTNATYANGVTEANAYNPSRGWLTSVTGTRPGGDMAFRAGYDRSATGRIFRADTQALVGGQPTDLGGSYDYAYDYTGRLLAATNWRGVTAFNQVFAYDRAGRIRAKGATLASATAYAYTDPSKPDHAPSAVTTAGVTTTFTYDANGNMLNGLGGKIMTYDGENRPLSVTHLGKRTCYVYGVDGKRLKKVEGLPPTQDCTALPANTNATVYFGAVEVRNWLVAGAEQVLTYPHPSVKLLNGTTPAVATYLHRDGLASVRAITNAAGAKIEAALYKPFGEQSEWLLPGNAAPETKGWIGERYDADAGLQYLNARYYDPELSLFLQPDWFEVTKAGVGTNRFSYSFNDPVNKFDPGGNESAKKKAVEIALKALKEAKDQAKKQAFETAKTQAAQRFASRANTVHKSGVPFDANGFPDFSNYLYKGGKSEVIIKYSGKRDMDEILANKAAGYKDTPEGYTWHHHQDFGKMQLVEKGAHKAVGHTGGFRFSEAAVQAGGSFDAAIQTAEKALNSHTMRALELFDPTTYWDLMYESQTGYSIWDSEEERWDKRCGSNPDRCT